MKALKVEKTQLDGFVSVLVKERGGRLHHRRKISSGRATFVTANVSVNEGVPLFGRVTGPMGNHAEYFVEVSPRGVVQIVIDIEDPTGSYTVDQAYADISYGILEMMKNPHKPDFSGGRNIKYLHGYYLKSTGKNEVGEKGEQTLADALKGGHISEQFREHCFSEGFTMEYYQLKTVRQKSSTSDFLGVST
jgi:hypothetical protein